MLLMLRLRRAVAALPVTRAAFSSSVRNIGIAAHVDAGKTTTTEQMLFCAGVTRRVGEVDSGNTVMDFMEQERERGITIQAAAISFEHEGTTINLIDTPGHVDFTSEVERSARVLDGAVVILDAVAGVQAQTENVWQQAERHGLSRIVFVNKMDRVGSSFEDTLSSMRERLGVVPLPIHLPVTEGSDFCSLVDVIRMEQLTFGDEGDAVETESVGQGHPMYEQAATAREELFIELAEIDDAMADLYLEEPDAAMNVSAADMEASIRNITLEAGDAVAVLCGASFRNKGVQPLMDAVVRYLPSPLEVPDVRAVRTSDNTTVDVPCDADAASTVCLAFKVQNDSHRGLLVFLRVYAGTLRVGMQVVNARDGKVERINKLVRLRGDEVEEVQEITAGHIGAVVGLRSTKTGDTLCDRAAGSPVALEGVVIPPPVFTVGAEAASVTEQAKLDEALAMIVLEDPSVNVFHDDELGQTLISGMGELHLEVVLEKLRSDYKVEAMYGDMRVSYRETVQRSAQGVGIHEVTAGTKTHFAKVGVKLTPSDASLPNDDDALSNNNVGASTSSEALLTLEDIATGDNGEVEARQRGSDGVGALPRHLSDALLEGVQIGLRRGILLGSPLLGVNVRLVPTATEWDATESTPAAFRAAACVAVQDALGKSDCALLEPIMLYTATLPPDRVGDVLSDLTSKRRAAVQSVETTEGFAGRSVVSVVAHTPLSAMSGYSTWLRMTVKGEGGFNLSFLNYGAVGAQEEQRLLGTSR